MTELHDGEYKANMHSAAAIRLKVESKLAKRIARDLRRKRDRKCWLRGVARASCDATGCCARCARAPFLQHGYVDLSAPAALVWIHTTVPPAARSEWASRLMFGTMPRAAGISEGQPSATK